jgi:hypothetical protein
LPTTTSIPLPHFLSTDIILLANIAGALELWTIQDQSDDTGPEIGLCLPEVSDGCQYHIQRVDNNPKGDTTQASQSLDYSFADSLVALSIVRIEQDGLEVQIMCLTIPGVVFCNNFPRLKTVARSVHRRNGALRSLDVSVFPPFDWPCGQRCVSPTADRSIVLLDFNPYTRKKTLLEQAKPK